MMKKFLLMMTTIMTLAGFTSCLKISGDAQFNPNRIELDAKAQTVEVTASGFDQFHVEEEGKPDNAWYPSKECLLEGDWYTLTGEESWKSFKITVTENTTGKERKIRVSAMQLDTQDFLTVIQKGE